MWCVSSINQKTKRAESILYQGIVERAELVLEIHVHKQLRYSVSHARSVAPADKQNESTRASWSSQGKVQKTHHYKTCTIMHVFYVLHVCLTAVHVAQDQNICPVQTQNVHRVS